jgi:hypothetical protein
MTLAIEIEKLPPQAQRILGPGAPAPMRMMAASGIVPGLKPQDVVCVVAVLTEADDAKVAEKARQTIRALPPPILNGALSADLDPAVVVLLADGYSSNAEVVEKLLRQPRIGCAALEILAARADERIGELVATNEAALLQNPTVIEKLYMNKQVRMSTADRILELAVRNGLELGIPAFKEAAAAIKHELIPERSAEPTFEDKVWKEADEIASRIKLDTAVEDTHETDEEGKEVLKEAMKPLYARLAELTVTQKIRRATLGDSAERMILLRDHNRLVATAAVQSPKMNENDAARIATNRQCHEDVLRIIAQNREWTRNYQIRMNLIMNPRTPFTFSSRMIPLLRDNDVRALAKSRNVTSSVQTAARQQLARKETKRK